MKYDEIGRLIQKNVGKLPAATLAKETTKGAAEAIMYGYNVRGWLNYIWGFRKPDNTNPYAGTQNFNFNLDYTAVGQFNGNIGKLTWNGAATTYNYDGLNRLSLVIPKTSGQHTESVSYDENGNITNLTRTLSGTQVDNLSYNYNIYSNKLLTVTDASDKTKGYVDINAVNDFTYDLNGNLINDKDKNITVSYNVLNLVRQVRGSTTQNYVYDGNGSKQAQYNGSQWKGYLGAGEYINNSLYRLGTSEGYIMLNANYVAGSTTGKYSYFYSLKDHLGNVRSVVTDDKDATEVQSSDYTAFGVAVTTPNKDINKYLYNGKELQDGTNWLDYGARMYQPELGRWMTIDPLAEKNHFESSYVFVHNNPLKYIDPDGRDGINIIDDKNKTITVRAVYFVQTEKSTYYTENEKTRTLNGYSAKEVASMQTNYNEYLNKAGLSVSEGEYKGYSVKFDLQFKEGGTVESSKESAKNTTERGFPVGNSLSIGNENTYPKFKSKEITNSDGTVSTTTVGGITLNRKEILMNQREDTKMNRIHEIFHTLGFDHPKGTGGNNGIMKYPPEKPNQSDANRIGNSTFLPKVKVNE